MIRNTSSFRSNGRFFNKFLVSMDLEGIWQYQATVESISIQRKDAPEQILVAKNAGVKFWASYGNVSVYLIRVTAPRSLIRCDRMFLRHLTCFRTFSRNSRHHDGTSKKVLGRSSNTNSRKIGPHVGASTLI